MEPRPKHPTPEMRASAARKIVNGMVRDSVLDAAQAEDSIKDIVEHGDTFTDGYELAKALDCHGWSIDEELVDALGGYRHELRREVDKAQKEWAERVKPEPPVPVGTRVKLSDGKQGEITQIYVGAPAQYLVKVDGTPDGDGQPRRIVNFEDAQAA